MIEVSDSNFRELVFEADKPVLVDFYAQWCQPCKAFAPVLESFSESQNDVIVLKADLEQTMDMATQYAVRSVPTLLLFKQDKLVAAYHGIMNKEALIEWVHRMLE